MNLACTIPASSLSWHSGSVLYLSRGPLCFSTTQACPSRTSKPAAYCCAPCSSSIPPSVHFFPLCVTLKSSWLVPYVVSLLMKRGRVVEDSEGEKWWHQRGGRLEKPVEIPSVKAEGSNRKWKEKSCITQHGTHGQDTNSPLQGWETTLKTVLACPNLGSGGF